VSLSPVRGQPEAGLGGYGAASRLFGPASTRALDAVMDLASVLISACALAEVRTDPESAMDYLSECSEFMLLLQTIAGSRLGRSFTGPEDAPFEELMVGLMAAVQSQLESGATDGSS